jgi:hypothetical protein
MQFNYGFEYMGVRYGWNKKQLYRLPFIRNKRSFNLLLVKPFVIGSTTVYNIQRTKVTINRLKKLTKDVSWELELVSVVDCPF